MRAYYFTASKDAIDIDFETTIYSDEVPDFWDCYELARENDCEFFTLFSDEEDGEQVYIINALDPDNGAESAINGEYYMEDEARYEVEQLEETDKRNGEYIPNRYRIVAI